MEVTPNNSKDRQAFGDRTAAGAVEGQQAEAAAKAAPERLVVDEDVHPGGVPEHLWGGRGRPDAVEALRELYDAIRPQDGRRPYLGHIDAVAEKVYPILSAQAAQLHQAREDMRVVVRNHADRVGELAKTHRALRAIYEDLRFVSIGESAKAMTMPAKDQQAIISACTRARDAISGVGERREASDG